MKKLIRGAVVGLAAALVLSACGGGDSGDDNPLAGGGESGTITVGGANFPESNLLAEIYAQALEAKDLKVTRKFNIGAREVYFDQVVKGGISVMPEYNGALLTTSVDENSKAVATEEINAELKAKLPASVEILDSAEAQDKDSVTVNPQTAAKYELKSIADLKDVANELVVAGPSEFETRQQGLKGLKSAYGIEFKEFRPFDAGAQSTLVKLLTENEIQAADLFTTDPTIQQNKLVVLEDPENVFSAQNVTPLVHKESVNDTARAALNAISAKLTTADLLDMMKRIVIDKDDQEEVAKDWLTKAGLL